MPDAEPQPAWVLPPLGEDPELPPLPPVTWRSARRNVLWFALTVVSVFATYGLVERGPIGGPRTLGIDWATGLQFTVAVFAILLAHEFGHYFAARYHRVDSSLPYFIPFPLGLAGTLGAFIRIRSPFPHRRALFDIGLAGPLAGFVVCLPVLVLGLREAHWGPLAEQTSGAYSFGEPLLFEWLAILIKGAPPPDASLFVGPLGMAAWFGLLVTALNLMPVGQLDGGHAVYALAPRSARWVTRAGLAACLLLVYHRPTWLVWATLLFLLGRRGHPPTLADDQPLGRARVGIALLTLVVFAVCFTPSPVFIGWREFFDALRELGGLLLGWFGFTSR